MSSAGVAEDKDGDDGTRGEPGSRVDDEGEDGDDVEVSPARDGIDASSPDDDARHRAGTARRPPGTARLPRDGATMHRGDGPARARPARAAAGDPPARAHALMPPCRRECRPAGASSVTAEI